MKKKQFATIIICFIVVIMSNALPSSAQAKNEDFFGRFILRFARDSVFQVQRVKFPLIYETCDEYNYEELTLNITKDRYHFIRLYFETANDDGAFMSFFDNFKAEFNSNSDEMAYKCWGTTDYVATYYFKRINGEWYLLKISNLDPWD